MRLVALVACGTRSLIDAVFGPTAAGETTYAGQLTPSMHTGMLVLADRNFTTSTLIRDLAATGAQLLTRAKTGRRLPVLRRLPDASFVSVLGGVRVRVIDAHITITTRGGRHTGIYRLVTTLTDERAWPATTLVALYHERWEIETCQPWRTHIWGLAA